MTVSSPTQPSQFINRVSEAEREYRINRVCLITGILSLSQAALLLYFTLARANTNLGIPTVTLVLFFLLQILMSQGMVIRASPRKAILLTLSLNASLIVLSVYVGGIALLSAGVILMYSLMVSTTLLENENADAVIPLSLMSAIFAGLLGTYPPVTQVVIPVITIVVGGICAILFVTFVALLATGIIVASLRIKITLFALFVVIFPLAVLSVIESTFMRNTLLAETQASLMNSTSLLAARVDEFFKTNRASIVSESNMPAFANYLNLTIGQRKGSAQEKLVTTAINAIKAGMKVKEAAYLDSFKLVDSNGYIAYSTHPDEVGSNVKSRGYFNMPMDTGMVYDSPVEFSPSDSKPYIYFSQTIRDVNQNFIGVLVAAFDARILQSLSKEFVSTRVQDSYPLIIDENLLRVADPQHEKMTFTTLVTIPDDTGRVLRSANRLPIAPITSLSTGQEELAAKLEAYQGQPFFNADVSKDGSLDYTAVTRMTSQPWYVLFVRDQASVVELLTNQIRLSIIIATLIAGAISMLATFIGQKISSPIGQLTLTAQQVTAGNLEARSVVTSKDEIGILAFAFNTMTSQLQQFIAGLEDRVQARTRELAERNDALTFRARQLETIAEVARGVNQTQSLENLLSSVTQLISERFNFYHVGIFLIDESGKFALLRAANSEGGQRMLARQHRLEVGQTGIVGYVTANAEARIATDVGQDAVFFNNPDLPLTRSEMALPLLVGERVIGALDVQSVESAAFSQEDIQVFKILADQVAIALFNNQLYEETRRALDEAHQVHQRYLQQEWSHETAQNAHNAYRYTPAGISALRENSGDGVGVVLSTGEIQVEELPGENGATRVMVVPVKLRGETIGAIRVQEDSSDGHSWADEEILTVQTVADQVALALENARLFNQTTRKAERERRVLEITSRIRSTNDPQEMMRIAVEEIQRALRASRAQVVLQPVAPAAGGSNGHNQHTAPEITE